MTETTTTTTTVSSTWSSVNVDCADSASLANFWGKVLGRPVSPGKTPGVMVVGLDDPTRLQMVFAQSTGEKGVGGFQPNLNTDHHDEEIERLVDLGATVVNKVDFPQQLVLTQLADPEGNLFNLATWRHE